MAIRKNLYMIALTAGLSSCEVLDALQRESENSYKNPPRTSYYSGGRIVDWTEEEDDKDDVSAKKKAVARGVIVGGLDALKAVK